MVGEDAEKFRKLCEESGEFALKKFGEMTGLIQKLDDNTVAYVGDNGIAVKSKDIDKEKALKYASQLDPVDDIASIVKQPIKLAGRSQINRANNSIDIALGASIKVLGGFTLTVREKGVEV